MSAINERSAFVEESGLFFESLGMTRMSGRILGYLMVTDKDMVSFDELTHVLHASKSSISTNIKALLNVHFIKPFSNPGDRKTYYTLAPDIDWSGIYRMRIVQLNQLQGLFEKGRNLRTNPKDKTSHWLNDAIEFYAWITAKVPALLEEWEEYKRNKG